MRFGNLSSLSGLGLSSGFSPVIDRTVLSNRSHLDAGSKGALALRTFVCLFYIRSGLAPKTSHLTWTDKRIVFRSKSRLLSASDIMATHNNMSSSALSSPASGPAFFQTDRIENVTLLLLYLVIPSVLISAVQLTWRNKKSGAVAKFPGPRLFPLIGRIHDLPRFGMWLKLKEWADIYGPIYQTKMLNQDFIILSDEKIAEELLVKRGHIYSGRPQIRSLYRHKEGPAYVALMDRHSMF